ncbi:hypothetical protein C8T65DRAFT_637207 [Cerioporus squamosus]|nr:hypothetical protein C8T65DRAFT_637207 [Cerioporus squamosus]
MTASSLSWCSSLLLMAKVVGSPECCVGSAVMPRRDRTAGPFSRSMGSESLRFTVTRKRRGMDSLYSRRGVPEGHDRH